MEERPAILRVPRTDAQRIACRQVACPLSTSPTWNGRSASSRILRRPGPMRKGLRIGIRGMPSGPAPPSSPGFPGRPSRKDLACRPRTDAQKIAYRYVACRPASSFAGRRADDRGPFSSCSPAAPRRKMRPTLVFPPLVLRCSSGRASGCRWRRKRVPVWRAGRDHLRGYAMDFDGFTRALDCGFGCPAATFVALRQPRLSSTRPQVSL